MTIHPSSTARARLAACLVLCVLGAALPARAWKPITHVYLAEKARAELLAQNGFITLQQVDFSGRHPTGAIGTYMVSSDIYQALRDYPEYYRAGVLGPDAYPDMLFGQSVIHPATEEKGSDSEPWLRHLYAQASTPAQRAFVMGFLAHGAGDMFGHTFVNHYALGPFSLDNGNAVRHILTEGHVGRRTPYLNDLVVPDPAHYTIDTSAVNTFIHDNMIDARRSRDGSWSNDVWKLTRNTQAVSPPRLFAELRAGLEDMLDAHYSLVGWLKEQIRYHEDRCGWRFWHCIQAGTYRGLLLSYEFIVGVPVQYVEAWVQDINRGLRAWPATSTEVARNLFMQTTHKANLPGAEAALSTYSHDYLCSMLGAPDAYCALSSEVSNLIAMVTFKIDLFRELKRRILDYVVKKVTGEDINSWKEKLDPEIYLVDQGVPANPPGPASSEQLDDLMGVSSTPTGRFDLYRFAPAYNTYAAIKMSFLDNQVQWVSVISSVGVWNTRLADKLLEYDAPNRFGGQVMLGFLRSMDWDNAWAKPGRMFIAQDCGLYTRLFMQQTGDLYDMTGNADQDMLRRELWGEWCGGPHEFFYFSRRANNATTGTKDRNIFLQGGETLSLGTCGVPGATGGGNTYLRLVAPDGRTEVAANDDACGGTNSHLTFTAPQGGGGSYTLRAGCADNADVFCGGQVAWTISGSFTYSAANTVSATVNTTSQSLWLVGGQRLQVGTCNVPGASGDGDTYLRLFNNAASQVASNDDDPNCWTLSNLQYVVPWGKGGRYQVHSGCFANNTCSGTVSYLLSEAYP